MEIDFSPRNTVNHLFNILKVNIESLYYGLKLIENDSILPERLKEDNDFIHFQIGDPLSESDLKNNLKQILLSKCFEDLIKGITLSLCDAYTLINFRLFLCNESSLTQEIIEDKYKKIYKDSHSINLPRLIEKISDTVGSELLYSKELITINRARNCFVHRKGIVYPEKDINNKENNVLTTQWVRPFFYQNKDGEEIEMIDGGIVTHETPLLMKTIPQEKSFKPYETINFSYKEILEIAYTFYFFGNSLVESQIQFLKNNEIKS